MSENSGLQFTIIDINSKKRKEIVINNIFKMLQERKLEPLNPKQKENDDTEYIITTNNKSFYIKLYVYELKSLSKSSDLVDFLKLTDDPRLIVVQSILGKTEKTIKEKFGNNIEIFLEKELMINIIDHIFVPKHILLNEEDCKKVLEDYYARKKDLPKILHTDPIMKYYNAKIGQIVRIIRPSELSGEAIYYRLVI
jgi:DNA-directed RNA polymerase subunit H (RpoH/RPB5)